MIQTISNFQPPQNAAPYNPAKTVTVPGNGEAEVILKGRNSDAFGFDRIIPFATPATPGGPSFGAMYDVEVSAELNQDKTIFKPVQLAVLRTLFRDHKLLAPYIIKSHNDLRFVLMNNSVDDVKVNMQVLGYDAPSLKKLVREYKEAQIRMPRPVFLYGNEEVPSGATNFPIDVPTKSTDVQLLKAAAITKPPSSMRLSMEIYNRTIKNSVYVEQLNDEYSIGRSMVPIEVGRNVPFTLKATNPDTASQKLSFLGEAYVYNN